MEIVTKVMEKSWKFVGKNVYEPCRCIKMKNLGWNREFWMCLVKNQNRECFVVIIYFIKYYKVIL